VKLKNVLKYALFIIFILGCGGGGAGNTKNTSNNKQLQPPVMTEDKNSTKKELKNILPEDYFSPEEVEEKVSKLIPGDVNCSNSILAGKWYGESNYMKIALKLDGNGTYEYKSVMLLGKYHNVPRVTIYKGKWNLTNSNSQIRLNIYNNEKPLILTNNFPSIYSPAGINLYPGKCIDTNKTITIDYSKDNITAEFTDKAKNILNQNVEDFSVDYFTMVAAKANSEEFWKSVDILPPGFNYGHKFDISADFEYAKQRMENNKSNYVVVISDENWQTMLGNRHKYKKVIQDPAKMYRWFEYFKDQMQILSQIKGPVIYIIAGDAPPYWAGDIRANFNNDPKNVPAKIIESRFPEVLERNPDNSFAGVFQMMDYLRMKYAPNVKLAYTLKTWGIAEKDIYHEPSEGWDNYETVKIMAEYLNNFGVQFDLLSFNFHPRSSHTTEEYESAAKYFGAISKLLKMRDNNIPKLWIWKLSLWNQEQTYFIFSHIDYLVDKCNAIGVTLGHGNDLVGKSGFSDNEENDNYLRSWIKEYYLGEENSSIPIHATKGLIYWR